MNVAKRSTDPLFALMRAVTRGLIFDARKVSKLVNVQCPQCRNTFDSSLSHSAVPARLGALGQMHSASQKTYGLDDMDFARWKRYEFPGAELSTGRFSHTLKHSIRDFGCVRR